MEIKTSKGYFDNLDALRFFSFLVVFLFHTNLIGLIGMFTSSPAILSITHLFAAGGWGVSFFFVLSGFLISWLLLAEKEKKGHINIRNFYIRRVLRIWPLYYIVIITGFFLLPLLYQFLKQSFYFDYNWFYYFFFLSNFGVIELAPAMDSVRSFPLVLNITWSVSIEEQFYIVWPLLFAFIPKRKNILMAMLIVLATSIIGAYFLAEEKLIYGHTITRMGELSIGGIAALLLRCSDVSMNVIRMAPKWVIYLFYLLSAFIIMTSFSISISPFMSFLVRLFGACVFAFIIAEQNFSTNSFIKFGRFKTASYLGRISYGLYMLHPLAMFFTNIFVSRFWSTQTVPGLALYICLSFILTIIMAYLSYNILEKRILRLKSKFL